MIIYLSLGSNIGNRQKHIEDAILELEKNNINKIKISSVYETQPVGPKQRNFYNLAGKFTTNLSPKKLLVVLKNVERKLGRKKTYRWGPRVIDIDILFYGRKIVNLKNLIIPHKEIINRSFVLVPLKEIAPFLIHPVYKTMIKTLCKNVEKT